MVKKSWILLSFLSCVDCEQALFCSKIRGEKRKTSERASVTVSVTFERDMCGPRFVRLAVLHGKLAGSRPLTSNYFCCVLLCVLLRILEQNRDGSQFLCVFMDIARKGSLTHMYH